MIESSTIVTHLTTSHASATSERALPAGTLARPAAMPEEERQGECLHGMNKRYDSAGSLVPFFSTGSKRSPSFA